MKVEFLMVCRADMANEEVLRELLEQALVESYDEVSEEELESMVSLTLSRPAPDGQDEDGKTVQRTLCCFDLELPEELLNLQLVIQDFADSLTDTPSIGHVLKFHDEHLLEENVNYMRELFGLEMKLRKALSLIYLCPYCDSPYEVLRDEVTEIRRNDRPDAGQMQKHRENELFHLLFTSMVRSTSENRRER